VIGRQGEECCCLVSINSINEKTFT
jgi:hypothetical protein